MSDTPKYQDNLKGYREKASLINEVLVAKAIEYIVSIDGALSLNNLSQVSFSIADATLGEKGLSPSTLSKNKSYKNLIDTAKYNQKRTKRTDKKTYTPNGSMADVKLQNFELIALNNKLSKELETYKYVLKNYTQETSVDNILDKEEFKNYKMLLQITKGLVKRILETELAMVDEETKELVISPYGDEVLLSKKAFNFIFEELN